MADRPTVLITGCTRGGIGHSLALDFHSRNYNVIASARSADKIADLKELGMRTIGLDVTDLESIVSAKKVLEGWIEKGEVGGLDVLVNNAGRNCTMPALDVDVNDARHCFETNFFAVVNMCQTFTPLLIKRKGLIVNIGSLAAHLQRFQSRPARLFAHAPPRTRPLLRARHGRGDRRGLFEYYAHGTHAPPNITVSRNRRRVPETGSA
ncbi:short chain dehydrogenase reductase protein [Rutstroemia sp. NJR-2017a BBW]|nr:short chain dehydrogenase reductase protein [Rutstroemia sp. NJR-2017a BBW]